jgi:hypothetical protein
MLSEALREIEASELSLQTEPAFWLKKVHLLGLMNSDARTLEEAKALLSELDKRTIDSPTLQYFRTFARWYGLVAHRRLKPGAADPANLLPDFSSISLKDVPRRWIETFPMPPGGLPDR